MEENHRKLKENQRLRTQNFKFQAGPALMSNSVTTLERNEPKQKQNKHSVEPGGKGEGRFFGLSNLNIMLCDIYFCILFCA